MQLFVGSLACLGTTTSIAAAAAITKASVQDPVREGSARSKGAYTYNAMSILKNKILLINVFFITSSSSRVLLEVVNVTIARPSLISMETFMERAEGNLLRSMV